MTSMTSRLSVADPKLLSLLAAAELRGEEPMPPRRSPVRFPGLGGTVGTERPVPPAAVLRMDLDEPAAAPFQPGPEMEDWVRATFLREEAPFWDSRLAHLAEAEIAFLWAAEPTRQRGMTVIGTAEIYGAPPSLSGWRKDRLAFQLREWFGERDRDFLITLCAPWMLQADDASYCATVMHELAHCGQRLDEAGNPWPNRDGSPVFKLKGHDVEVHLIEVEWFGVDAAAGATKQLVEAAQRPPLAGRAAIVGACGNCLRPN